MKNERSLVPLNYFEAKSELEQIMTAGAKSLRLPGLALLPIKREMLAATGLPPHETELVLDACNLLFAAILSYEYGLFAQRNPTSAIELIEARIKTGSAEGVVNSLFYGPTADLLLTAMNLAPIAFYAMSEASPNLQIIDRCYQKRI